MILKIKKMYVTKIVNIYIVERLNRKYFIWRLNSQLSINSLFLGAYGCCVGRDFYRATPAVTCDFGSSGRVLGITQLVFF